MRFTVRFLSWNAAAYVLVALIPLNVDSQDAATLETHGFVVVNMDRSVKPGDDFYHYANGNWIKHVKMPADRGYIDPYGSDLDDYSTELTRKRTAEVIQEAANANAHAGSNVRKIADLYHSYMDQAAVDAKGLTPLRSHLDAVAAIREKRDLARALGQTLRADVDPLNYTHFHTPNLFGLWVGPGFHDPGHYGAYLLQGGLEMPDREYYLSNSDSMLNARAKYQVHVSALLKMAGFSHPEVRARHVVDLEHAIAEMHVSFADEQDISKADNAWKQADFAARAPGLDWTEYFRGAGLSGEPRFIVWQPSAITGEAALVASVALDSWKDWLTFHLIEDYASVLPETFGDEHDSFFEKTLSGTTEQRPRWQRSVTLANSLLGDAIGQIYVQRYFSSEVKTQIQAMVDNLISEYRRRIDALPWMDPSTKAEAQAKLTALYVGIGYPETWCNYADYDVSADDLFGNLWRGGLFEYKRSVARLGHPVDRKEWASGFYPQSVGALQLPLQIAIDLPAALLVPHFDPQASTAANYGKIGQYIGHEISHTFDTEGSAVDSTGRVRNWWKPSDLARFNAATNKLATQLDTYKPFPDLGLNGKQNLVENIADLAGLAATYDAYRASLGGKAPPVQNGFSGDQQFFIAFAQFWASKSTESFLREQVMTDVHAPDEYKVDTVRNLDTWYAAFKVQPGDKLYLAPADRVRIW